MRRNIETSSWLARPYSIHVTENYLILSCLAHVQNVEVLVN